jgi:hypothetical protein
MNVFVAVWSSLLLALTAIGLHGLQSRLERWDHDRHFDE